MSCAPGRLEDVSGAVADGVCSEVRERLDNILVVVTDTATLDEDRAEVERLMAIDGVAASHVVFSNIEDVGAALAKQEESR